MKSRRSKGGAVLLMRAAAAAAAAQLEADFVVVGSGPGGATVAGRLAQAPSRPSVVLIEAGSLTGDEDAFVIPYDWGTICNFHSVPNCPWEWEISSTVTNINGGVPASLWQGKQTGGNGKNNAMLYIRGAEADFRDIANISDSFASKWNISQVHSYFQILENASQTLLETQYNESGVNIVEVLNDHVARIDDDGEILGVLDVYQLYGENVTYGAEYGAVDISEPLFVEPVFFSDLYIPAWEGAGMPTHDGMNGPGDRLGGKNGATYTRFDICPDSATRCDPFEKYIRPLISENAPEGYNFTLITDAQVTNLTMEDSGDGVKRITGVTYVKNGQTETVVVNKEAIISAGALLSPKILMLSGIGHSEHLQEVGIPVEIDLPVGDGVKDHVTVPQFFQYNEDSTYTPVWANPTQEQRDEYYDTPASGPLTNPGPMYMSFFRANSTGIEEYAGGEVIPDGPNLQFTVTPKPGWLPTCCEPGFQHMLTLTEPLSTGTIRLSSSNPFDAPAVHIGYLEDPADLQTLWQGFVLGRKIFAQDSLSSQGYEKFPGEDNVTNFEEFENYVRNGRGFMPVNHYTGGCTMGQVVDADFKVYGTSNLRVADASIAPQISTNTQATTMMFGAYLSETLNDEYYPSQPIDELPL